MIIFNNSSIVVMNSKDCAVVVTLLFIIFEGRNLDPVAADLSSVLSDGALLTLDTGADVSYLYEAFYDPLINEVYSFIILNIILFISLGLNRY